MWHRNVHLSLFGIVSFLDAADYTSCKITLCPSTEFLTTVSDSFVKNTHPLTARECTSFNFSGFFRDWIQLANLPATSPLRSSPCVPNTVRVFRQNTHPMAIKESLIFHISGLVRDWIQLTTLISNVTSKHFKVFSTTVRGVLIKVKSLMAAQEIYF